MKGSWELIADDRYLVLMFHEPGEDFLASALRPSYSIHANRSLPYFWIVDGCKYVLGCGPGDERIFRI